jgi:hypothetical protein
MELTDPVPVIYTAQSKLYFYCRDVVCEYVIRHGCVPLNPFRVFEYFLGDRVRRDDIRRGNNNLIRICDEVWVFGPIADGVLSEIRYAHRLSKPVKYYSIGTTLGDIHAVPICDVSFEPQVHSPGRTRSQLLTMIRGDDPFSLQLPLF